MSECFRMELAAKLLQGVTMERILDDIRDSVCNKLHREHLVIRQDLHNIKKKYNMDGVIRHKNDLTSVTAWVEEMKTLPYNPILRFKQQGFKQFDHLDNIADNDFFVCMQNEFQRDMCEKLAGNAVCIDSTHGTNTYDFKVITMLVVDEYGEGIPVGWLICNREDAICLVEFFKAIKERTGDIKPNWFMSDDAGQFYNAWVAVFGDFGMHKLICAWHLDRSWRNALREHVRNNADQADIYYHLRTLLMENNEAKFRVMLQEFLTYLKSKNDAYFKYFKDNYCTRVQQWASCYRYGCTVNTNMFLEAFHRVLKIIYFNHKQNRRIDFLLTTLMKIARDKAFERFNKEEKGKNTHRVCEINKRHKSAEELKKIKDHSVTALDNSTWRVQSQTTNTQYIVQQHNRSCVYKCKLLCSTCAICPHMYSCTCLDFTLHCTVCKHIHLIHMLNTKSPNPESSTLHQMDSTPYCDYDYYSKILGHGNQTADILQLTKQSLNTKILQLQTLVEQCDQVETLNTVRTHLQAAITVIKALRHPHASNILPIARKIAPNTNNETQPSFFFNKEKKEDNQQTFKAIKPTNNDM